jgi:lipopolysaccharide/colanic/teichoic acid biosynthesis glycosyltransferase
VLSPGLFRRVLAAERRRANRANQPLTTMMLSIHDIRPRDTGLVWRHAIDAVTDQTRDTDVIGWLSDRRALAVILDGAPADEDRYARDLEVRIRRDLAGRVDAETVARVVVSRHTHSLVTPDARDRQRVYDGLKRLLDIVLSLTLLVLLAPLFVLIAALVKLKSPGPVFYRQARIGRMMKPFEMLKFRTMHVDADHALHHAFVSEFIKSGGGGHAKGAPGVFKIVDDPRVTPIGALLRKTSLDELPQLWNVLRGQMSLVGPRPPLPYEVEQYKPWHTRRVIEAKPGITGLWQVGGRSRTTFDDMVRLDLRYARARSLTMDLRILLATPRAVVSGKGAC